MSNHLHIVCFDVPFPVSHGGFFDLYYKITALSAAGVKIHLHCFVNKRPEQPALKTHCATVDYYPRKTGRKGFSFNCPYIVYSRRSTLLIERLLQDEHPILLEGIHCSFLLEDERFKGRRILLRAHNVETLYYRALAKSSPIGLRRTYYAWESHLLAKQEKKAGKKTLVLTVTKKDAVFFKENLQCENCETLPVFLPYTAIEAETGIGKFCLYHGNLSIPENEKAVLFLVKEVFNDISFPLVITGGGASAKLLKAIKGSDNATLESAPDEQKLSALIRNAQIHILPSFNNTGIKLKLLHALFNGRHCITNWEAVEGTGLEPACYLGNTPEAMKSLVAQLFHQPFGEEEIRLREKLLLNTYNNANNAGRLIQWLYLHYP